MSAPNKFLNVILVVDPCTKVLLAIDLHALPKSRFREPQISTTFKKRAVPRLFFLSFQTI